ncbi:hypothetical protein F2Q70_00000830 [Brassica cretica]|uniref:Uncharacterized protein n=1 Tax=Brassica cretica TaxID=69181 RepID=A0A8S9IP50_BRACR|nr:hypothetical protein F2Q70_00000830 [Brassica cretica]
MSDRKRSSWGQLEAEGCKGKQVSHVRPTSRNRSPRWLPIPFSKNTRPPGRFWLSFLEGKIETKIRERDREREIERLAKAMPFVVVCNFRREEIVWEGDWRSRWRPETKRRTWKRVLRLQRTHPRPWPVHYIRNLSPLDRPDAFQGLTGLWVMIGPNGVWTVLGKKYSGIEFLQTPDRTPASGSSLGDTLGPTLTAIPSSKRNGNLPIRGSFHIFEYDRFQELRLRPRLGRMVRTEVALGKAKEREDSISEKLCGVWVDHVRNELMISYCAN